MASVELKNFKKPDETRSGIPKATIDVINVGNVAAMRTRFEPGWRWSECVKPVAGTDTCQVPHLIYVISGRMVVRMDDGKETEFNPGDMGSIPPGHDAWVVGSEPFEGIDFQGGAFYAKPTQ